MERPIQGQIESPNQPQNYPYDAVVILPYTATEREVDPSVVAANIAENKPDSQAPYGNNPRQTHRLSHFTARAALAGWELYQEGQAPRIFVPGEGKNPSTGALEKAYFERKNAQAERTGTKPIDPNQVVVFENLNGTQQQLDPIADLQEAGKLGKVLVVSFEFHKKRVKELLDRWKINGDIAEVEGTHERYSGGKASREKLINLPQLEPIKKAENGIPRILMALDKRFGRKAPFSRTAKAVMGSTVTDLNELGLLRIKNAKRSIRKLRSK